MKKHDPKREISSNPDQQRPAITLKTPRTAQKQQINIGKVVYKGTQQAPSDNTSRVLKSNEKDHTIQASFIGIGKNNNPSTKKTRNHNGNGA